MFRSRHDCTSAFSVRSPCNFGLQACVAISVLREVRKCCAYLIPLVLAAVKVIHENNWKRLGVLEHLHLPDRAWTPVAILADHATSFLVLPRCRHFYWGFRFLLILLTHSFTSFCCWIFRADHSILRWRCWRSRWRWSRGTRRQVRDNEWYVARNVATDPFAILGEKCFLTTGLVEGILMIFAELPEGKNCGCFFKKHNRHE